MINKVKSSIEVSLLAFVFVLSIIGVGLYGIQESNKQNKVSKELYQDRMIPVGQLGEIRHHLSDMLLIISRVNQDKVSFNDAEKLMNRDLDSIHVFWNSYLHTYFTNAEKSDSSKTTVLFHKFSETAKKLKWCLKHNKSDTFNAISENEFYPITTLLLNDVNDLIFLQLKEGKNIFEKSFIAYDTSKQESIHLMILILAFSIPVFYYLIKKNRTIIDDLNSSGEKLIEVEQNYRDFIDYAGDAILILDAKDRITDLNESACNLFGYSREELFQMEIIELIFPDETNQIKDKELAEYNKSRLIYRKAKRKDGTFIDTEITNWMIEGDGSFAIIRDITERKNTEAIIKESEEKYRYLFDNNPAHIIIWDFETLKVLEVNNTVLESHGYSKSDWENMSILDCRYQEDHNEIKGFTPYMFDNKNTIFERRGRYLKKNGEAMLMDVSSHKIEYNNRKAVLSLARDVTEQLKAENELKESEEKYHSFIEHAADAIFVIDINTNIIEVNSSACEMLGCTKAELLTLNTMDICPSNTQESVAKQWNYLIENTTLLSETKFKRKDGSLIDVEVSRRILGNTSFLSIVRDITERKKFENELIESREKLNLFIEHTPASVAMFDTDMRYISTSRSWLNDYNLVGTDIIGKSHYEIVPGISQEWKDIHQRCLQGTIVKKDEDFFIREDGRLEWIRWEVHPWNLACGDIGGIIMFVDIITERKNATDMFKYQFENSPDTILYIDKHLKIEAINKPGSLELSIEELIGKEVVAVLPEYNQQLVKEQLNKCIETGESIGFEFEIYPNNWACDRYVPIIANGEVTHVMIFSTDITTRKQAEQKLVQSEEKHRSLIENISDAILLVNEDFLIEYISPSAERISGFSFEEAKSQKIFDFIHPEDVEKEKEFFEKSYDLPGISLQKELRFIDKKGETIWSDGRIVNLLDNSNIKSYVINFRDISSKKKLEQQQALMSSIVNSSDDAIISKNIDGIVTSWNIGAEKVLGYTAEEMIGKSITNLIPLENILEEKNILKTVRSGSSVEHFETKRLRKNGEIIDVSLTISPVKDVLGNIVGASKIMRDITDSKNAEHELVRYNDELKKANSELDRFVYSASHDLRAPLKSVLGLLSITKDYANSENVELLECLSMLNNSVFKLDNFIEDILNYSRNTRMELENDVIDFKELITKIRENYLYIDGVNDFKVQLEMDSKDVFITDLRRISVVLNNLFSNAFKYKDKTKKNQYLKIGFSCDSQTAKITIEDNGIGIANKDKEKVFDMFYRATMLSSGSGLGLYIVKETIDKLNGEIRIESEFGIGTKFCIEIPNCINALKVKQNENETCIAD